MQTLLAQQTQAQAVKQAAKMMIQNAKKWEKAVPNQDYDKVIEQ